MSVANSFSILWVIIGILSIILSTIQTVEDRRSGKSVTLDLIYCNFRDAIYLVSVVTFIVVILLL